MVPMRAHSSSVAAPAEPASLRGRASATFFGLLLIGLLAGCGNGGGGNGAPSTSGGNVLSGTAATGAPIASGTVTLKDSVGVIAPTTITKDNGTYSFDVGAMRFPVMLKVQPNVSGAVPLFSAALASGTANITPLTTLQVFEAVGRTDPSEIYNSGDFSKIGQSSLDQGRVTITSNLATQFTFNGLDPFTVNPITIPMVANGVGVDAVLDQTNVAIVEKQTIVTDSTGKCIPYGPVNAMTLAINGINGIYSSLFKYAFNFGADMSAPEYVKKALAGVCAPGIDQLRPVAPNMLNPMVMRSDVPWVQFVPLLAFGGDDTFTNAGVAQLKIQLTQAKANNVLAIQRGGIEGPINIVAHSWGTVIAYIALTQLSTSPDPTEKAIKVANLITMGSPIECLAGDCSLISNSLIQQYVPSGFTGPIKVPKNVTTWTNFVNAADIIASNITIPPGENITNVPVADCPAPPSSGTAGTTPMLATSCTSHGVYYDDGDIFPGTLTLSQIRSLIAQSSAGPIPAPTTPVPPPTSTTPAPLPLAFSLTAGTPYCDTRTPVGPAVNLAWSASNGTVYYRVFRNDNGIGVNLTAPQLSFINNLGLVAGQTYSYKVQAMNANGTTWSTTAQVTIPADVCSLNFTSPSPGTITVSTVGYQPTLTASGNVTQVSFSWSGATSGSATWVKNDANWLSKVTSNPDGSITLRPVVTQTGDPSGITNWTVTLRDSTGATRTQGFSVNYQPTVPGGGGSTLLPDLVVDTVTATPTSAAPGASITVTFTVRNQGAGAIPATLARIRLASGTTIQLADPLLAEVTVPGLAAGAAITFSQPVTIPAGTAAGNYFMGVTANAPLVGVPEESNPNNNQRTTPYTVANNTAGAGTLVVNGFASSYSTSTTPYTPLINLTGSGLSSITQVSWTCTMPNGVSCTGSPYVWTSANNWNGGKFTQPTDTSVSVFPTLLTGATGEPTGTYFWSVTFSGAGQSVTKTFTVNYTPAAAAPAIPATPMNPSPGSTSSPGPTLGSSAVTVSWNASSGATLYIGGITDIAAGSDVVTISTSSTSIPATLSPGKQYRWYVYACNSSGCSSSSALYYFQTPAVTGTTPATPTGTAPGNTTSPGPTTSSTTVGLSWSAVSGATSYSLGVRDIATNVLVVDTIISSTSFNAGLASGKSYRWNVAACNSAGCSNFSTVLFFRTP